jgi:hypothetical protein
MLSDRQKTLILTAVLFCFFWVVAGYRFYVNAGIETVPLIERARSAAFLPTDYYLNLLADTIHHRYLYVRFLAALAWLSGSVERAMLLSYVALYLILFNRLAALGAVYSASARLRVAALLFATAFLYFGLQRLSPGEVGFLPNETISNLFARAILLAGLVAAVRGRHAASMAILVFAAAFHPLEALLAFPFFAVLFVDRGVGLSARSFGAAAIWFLPLAAVVLAASADTIGSGAGPDVAAQAFEGRLSHHYLPGSWPLRTWVFLAAVAVLGTASLQARGLTCLRNAALVSLALFVAYLIVLSAVGGSLLLSLQGAKVMMMAYVVWTVSLSFDLFAGLARVATAQPLRRLGPFGAAAGLAALLVGAGVAAFSVLPASVRGYAAHHARTVLSGNYRTASDYVDRDEAALYGWLANNTAKDAVILHPPELQMIRPLAARSSVVQNKLIGFTGAAMQEWLERMASVQNYCTLDLPELRRIAERYKASWIVVATGCRAAVPAEAVFRNAQWLVVRAPASR